MERQLLHALSSAESSFKNIRYESGRGTIQEEKGDLRDGRGPVKRGNTMLNTIKVQDINV